MLPHTAAIADDLCFVKTCKTDLFNHAPAKLFMNTGSGLFGRPSMGAWMTYGLGSECADLPGFVVLQSGPRGPRGGASLWSSGMLPSTHQGVPLRAQGEPILNLTNPQGVAASDQRKVIDAVRELNATRLAKTGDDEISARGLYRDKKDLKFDSKPVMHSNYMPVVDTDDAAARNRLWVAQFGSTFPAGLTEKDVSRRRYPRIENLRETMALWAPFHFLLMLEALRDFRRRNCVLPPGAQQIEGSLMHQEVVAQTPEGRLRAWVEANYTHVPLREKDTGTKLDVLYTAYTSASQPVHPKPLGRNTFAKMLNAAYPNIGPHKNSSHTVNGIYLLR
jgi:hypothetical protein